MDTYGNVKRALVLLISLVVMLLLGCSEEQRTQQADVGESSDQAAADETVEQPRLMTITPTEALRLLEGREDVLLVDVRTPQERRRMRIEGSQPVEVGDVMRGVFEVSRDRPIVLLCAVGGRSFIAGKVLTGRGYQEVYNLDGGIEAWRRAGLPLETGPEQRRREAPVSPSVQSGDAGREK